MTHAQIKQAEELKALQTKLHSDWLKHPVTVDMFKILDARQANQIKELQEGILISSHEMKEHKYRSSIAALQAFGDIAYHSNVFVEELNKLTPNT